ncbi:MAG TPA: hypothetical protein DDX92_09725 [Flavobacteriales bacterium]|jgi:signal transduction histidine kinase|nr:hypothetical protein [Flavobacteriales bacterium]
MSTRILIVEDDSFTSKLISGMLEKLGYVVSGVATNSTEAFNNLKKLPSDLALMDIGLADKDDGVKLTKELSDQFGIPIIYVTSASDDNTVKRAIASLPYGYVVKPISADSLYTVIELALQRRHLENQLIRSQDEMKILNNQLEDKVRSRTSELREKNETLEKEILRRKKSEAKLKVALAKEKELNELKSRIVSIISHEIKTPLTGIRSSAELIDLYLRGDRLDKQKIDKHANSIMSSVERLTDLINDTLLIGRIESGKVVPKSEEVFLRNELEHVIDEINRGFSNSHEVLLTYSDEVEEPFFSDNTLLRQIMTNIISNAVKYSPDAELVEVHVEKKEKNLVLAVRDYGLGIPAKDQKLLFQMFHRASNTSNIEGAGLGLAIVKRSVEALGGTIHFDSYENQGSTFIVSLPIFN